MSNVGLGFATALQINDIAGALKYGKDNLDDTTYNEVLKCFKKLIKHTLLWILIAAIVGFIIFGAGVCFSRAYDKELLQSNGATRWQMGVRTSATTVLYTRGETHRYDVSKLGINLDDNFPNQRSLVLLLDDDNRLHSIVSNNEFEKYHYFFVIGGVFGAIAAIVIILGFYVYIRKHALYAIKWYAFLKWVNTHDESFFEIIKADRKNA